MHGRAKWVGKRWGDNHNWLEMTTLLMKLRLITIFNITLLLASVPFAAVTMPQRFGPSSEHLSNTQAMTSVWRQRICIVIVYCRAHSRNSVFQTLKCHWHPSALRSIIMDIVQWSMVWLWLWVISDQACIHVFSVWFISTCCATIDLSGHKTEDKIGYIFFTI